MSCLSLIQSLSISSGFALCFVFVFILSLSLHVKLCQCTTIRNKQYKLTVIIIFSLPILVLKLKSVSGDRFRFLLFRQAGQVEQHLQPGGLRAVQTSRNVDPQSSQLFGDENDRQLRHLLRHSGLSLCQSSQTER